MTLVRPLIVTFLSLLALAPRSAGAEELVNLPLADWQRIVEAAAVAERAPAPVDLVLVDRRLEGRFSRGVLEGRLVMEVEQLAAGALRIPVLDPGATPSAVLLDGRPTSLSQDAGWYVVHSPGPGPHRLELQFYAGRQDDRYARQIQLRLPPGGPISLSLSLPEPQIEASLAQGGVTAVVPEGTGSRVEGQLDGRGLLDLSWRSQQQQSQAPLRMESRLAALFELQEALVRGRLSLRSQVVAGEADQLRLQLPPGVEVVEVQGPALLQWQVSGGQLVAHLRHVLTDQVELEVVFQYPADLDQPVDLRLPLPEQGWSGSVGLLGPAGLEVQVQSAGAATTLQDLPPELAAMTDRPLLLGLDLAGQAPQVQLGITRNAEVELADTVIDDLEAATVILEEGSEVGLLQLRLRNQTRQHLAARLPEGAQLTQALMDGRPIRPAQAPDGRLLFPLMQSERVSGGQTWVVQEGDTLGGIADRFYSNPERYRDLMVHNEAALMNGLNPGTVLVIPQDEQASAERSFVIELAWRRESAGMGWLGQRRLELPVVEADVVKATWHLYVPDSTYALDYGGNLTQYSDIRYDHLRRLGTFLREALGLRQAWAGDYQSILTRRKSIYAAESRQQVEGQEARASFPLVGRQVRFQRLLPGREALWVRFAWMEADLVQPLRWLALIASAAGLWARLAGRSSSSRLALLYAALLALGWFVEGVHRRVVWGVDLALLTLLLRGAWPDWREGLSSWRPGLLVERLRFSHLLLGALAVGALLMLVLLPMLWSTLLLIALAWRARRSS